MSETYTPPKSAVNNAKRGLDLRKKYGRGGLTPAEAKSYGIDSGITRAKRISKGKLSRHDVRRMSAFNRHRQNYNPSKKMADGGPTAGTIAWLLWGGTSGVNWAKKKSAAMNAESFEAEGGRWGKGNLKLSNSEITQLLLYENWKCSNCDNSIKNKQNIPFSEEEKDDITWTIFAPEYDLQNYDDINIVTKGIRGTKGNVVKLEDGTLNFDNLHVLCNGCGQRKKIGRAVTLSFRTSKEKKEWLKSLAKDKNKGMAEIMSDVIDEYRNNYEEESFEAESKMECPPATKDVAINTKNRNATIKNFDYGPLNVEEPGDFWKDIAEQWKTTEKAAKKSNCGNCVAFDRSPRMKACMPGETSDGEGVLGYCWMHHFKCHSARTCDTWAKGGPITTNKVSEGWQERAFAKSDKASENFSSDWTEKSFDDGGGYDYTCMLILDIRDASKDYPLYTRIEEGSGFALKPLAIIKIKELILSGLNLNGVDYAGTTITAESIIFKFNFNNLDEAEDYFKYLNQHISIMMAKNHDEIPDNELCPHCMFSKVLLEVVDKYELGIKIANLMDWSNKEQTIDFLEYLIALENVDIEYVFTLLRGRGVNISKPNDYNGNSTKQLIVAEKNGYESMIEYIINELKNKKRSIDVVAFTLIADNGLKEQITNNIEQILKIDYSQLSSNLEKQLYLNQGKLAGIEDFLYYFYSDSSDFIFDNI